MAGKANNKQNDCDFSVGSALLRTTNDNMGPDWDVFRVLIGLDWIGLSHNLSLMSFDSYIEHCIRKINDHHENIELVKLQLRFIQLFGRY